MPGSSDAVALALTVGCPIYITKNVATYTVSIKDLLEEQEKDSPGSASRTRAAPIYIKDSMVI